MSSKQYPDAQPDQMGFIQAYEEWNGLGPDVETDVPDWADVPVLMEVPMAKERLVRQLLAASDERLMLVQQSLELSDEDLFMTSSHFGMLKAQKVAA